MSKEKADEIPLCGLMEDEDEDPLMDMDWSEFDDMPGVTIDDYLIAHDWKRNRENVLEDMRAFVKEFVPIQYQVEFAGSGLGVFNGCLVDLEAIGTPGVAEDGDDEPLFKAIKKCSRLYHSDKSVPSKLILVSLGYQKVVEYNLEPCADDIKKEFNEFDQIGSSKVSCWPERTDRYSYADPEGKEKLFKVLYDCRDVQYLTL